MDPGLSGSVSVDQAINTVVRGMMLLMGGVRVCPSPDACLESGEGDNSLKGHWGAVPMRRKLLGR
jgi:hypothetical protein